MADTDALLKALIKAIKQQSEKSEATDDLRSTFNEVLEPDFDNLLKTTQQLKEEGEKILNARREFSKISKENLSTNNEQLLLNKSIFNTLDDQLNILVRKKELEGELTEEEQERLKALEDEYALAQKNLEISEKRVEQEELADNAIKNIAGSLGIATSQQETLLGRSVETGVAILTNAEAAKKFAMGLGEVLLAFPSSIVDKIIESTIALAKSYDSAAASFNAATGAGGEYNEVISQTSQGNLTLGVSATESAKALGDLFNNMSSFTSLSKAEAATLATTTAALENIGVSAAVTAQNLDKLTRFLGLSAEQAMNQQRELAEFASGIGVAPAKMAEDFAKAGPLLVKYGQAGTGIFKDLAKQAKATGIEMSTLLDITGKFDTFEGAADAAGKLNAILGGNLLNSVDLLTASEEERVEMLRQSVIESGRSFDQLGRFEKQAIMAAAGISDLETAQRLFGDSSIEVTEEQKNFNEMVEKSQSLGQKFEKLMMSMAVTMGPFIDSISESVTELTDYVEKNREMIQGIASVLAVLFKLIAMKKLLNLMFNNVIGKLIKQGGAYLANAAMAKINTKAKKELNKAEQQQGNSIKNSGKQALQAAGGMLAFGAAVALVGAGIYFAATGIANLVESFRGLNSEQIEGVTTALLIFGGILVTVGVGIALAAKFLGGAALIMLVFGASVLVVGAGVFVLAAAFELFVDQLNKPGIDKLPMVAISMLGLAAAAGILAMSLGMMIFALPGVVILAGAIASLAAGLSLIKTDDLVALGNIMSGLSNITVEKSVNFKASMDGLENVLDAVGENEEAIKSALLPVVTQFTAPVTSPLIVPGSATPPADRTGISKQPVEIVLKLNDREIGRVITDKLSQVMNLRTA